MRATILVVALALAGASAAFAQDTNAQAPSTQGSGQAGGPLVIEPVRSPFVIAPEYKVTELDHRTGQLAGVYAGKLLDEQLLIGGAIYKLTNLSRDFDLTYGGVIVGWSTSPESRVRFGVRTLAGFGEARVPVTINVVPLGTYDPRQFVRFGSSAPQPQMFPIPQPAPFTVRIRNNFAVLEPEAHVTAHMTEHAAIEFSAGYRVTGFNDALRDDRLNGVTGSLALQLGW